MRTLVAVAAAVLASASAFAVDDQAAQPGTTLIGRMCAMVEGPAFTNRHAHAMCLTTEYPTKALAAWPFNPRSLEDKLARLLPKDGSAPSSKTTTYVSRVFAEWSSMQLDGRYPRASTGTVARLVAGITGRDPAVDPQCPILVEKGDCRVSGQPDAPWTAAWKLDGENYLLLTMANGDPLGRWRYYFVLWDGKRDWPVAYFDEFPDSRRAWCILNLLTSASACSDLAAYLDWREANRGDHDVEYVRVMVREAMKRGENTAAWNMGVLMERAGELETARMLFDRYLTTNSAK